MKLLLICMCICNVHRLGHDQDSTWMTQLSGLRKELLLSLPKAQLTQAPLVSASPSPSQCSVQPPPAACRKAQLQPPSFTFYIVHGVSE